ncbi:MAG: MGDG synthase family glycosyltransferase [Telluria sp.]
MAKTKLLLVSASSGNGHTRAAEALCVHARGAHVTATHIDILQFASPLLRSLYCGVYEWVIKHAPDVWKQVYRTTDRARANGARHALRRWAERLNTRRFVREVEISAPDLIVCTHFLPAEILSRRIARGALTCPVWVQVTDFDLHAMWVHQHMAGYLVANDEVAFRLRWQGIPPDRIHVTGIPIMPAFAGQLQRSAATCEPGIVPRRLTILLLAAGPGFGTLPEVAERLMQAHGDIEVIALAGRDEAALDALHLLADRHRGRLFPKGYTDRIEQLMACADLVVTKPGGLITSECMALGLPMLLTAPIPGQEEHNANFLLEGGAALKAFDLPTLEYRIRHLLAHPSRLHQLRANARALGKPEAASRVLATILRPAAA